MGLRVSFVFPLFDAAPAFFSKVEEQKNIREQERPSMLQLASLNTSSNSSSCACLCVASVSPALSFSGSQHLLEGNNDLLDASF